MKVIAVKSHITDRTTRLLLVAQKAGDELFLTKVCEAMEQRGQLQAITDSWQAGMRFNEEKPCDD